MKTKKLNLKNIQTVLSRSEMKKVMAGSSGDCGNLGDQCNNIFGKFTFCCPPAVCDNGMCVPN